MERQSPGNWGRGFRLVSCPPPNPLKSQGFLYIHPVWGSLRRKELMPPRLGSSWGHKLNLIYFTISHLILNERVMNWIVPITHLIRLFVTPRMLAHQDPLSMEFSRQQYWSGLPFLSPGYPPYSGMESVSHIAGRFSTVWVTKEAIYFKRLLSIKQRGNKVILEGTHLYLWNANVISGPFRNPYLCHLLKMQILKRG